MLKDALTITNLTIGYSNGRSGSRKVAQEINLSLRAGEMVCLLGPNGAGKSTLLRTLSAMQPPLEGEVSLAGQNIQTISKINLARKLSVVLTDRVTAGLLTGYEIVGLGRSPYTGWSGTLAERDHIIIAEAIRSVGAEALAQRYVGELSDGERQKIMLARALAQEPEIMILDEITAFLDLPRRVEIMHILRRLAHSKGRAILLSTHDLELALSTADRVWLMLPGRPVLGGTPEDLVLNGSFAEAFSSEGVRFDEEKGSFATHPEFHTSIGLRGEGTLVSWTRRALERSGYRVQMESTRNGLGVSVSITNGRPMWKSSNGVDIRHHDSVEQLLESLASETKVRR